MADILGVTWQALRGWCDEIDGFEQSGAFVRGGNGIEWTFSARKTVNFLIGHFEAAASAQERKGRQISKAVGVTLPDDETASSFEETKGLVNLTLSVVAAAERQGRYVLADDLAAFVEGYNQRVVAGILGVRTKIDPTGNLPTKVRGALDDYLRSLASDIHAEAERFVKQHAGIQQERVG